MFVLEGQGRFGHFLVFSSDPAGVCACVYYFSPLFCFPPPITCIPLTLFHLHALPPQSPYCSRGEERGWGMSPSTNAVSSPRKEGPRGWVCSHTSRARLLAGPEQTHGFMDCMGIDQLPRGQSVGRSLDKPTWHLFSLAEGTDLRNVGSVLL